MALVLLTGSGLSIRSIWRLFSINPGFRTDHRLTFHPSRALDVHLHRGPQSRFAASWPTGFRPLPRVRAATLASGLPMESIRLEFVDRGWTSARVRPQRSVIVGIVDDTHQFSLDTAPATESTIRAGLLAGYRGRPLHRFRPCPADRRCARPGGRAGQRPGDVRRHDHASDHRLVPRREALHDGSAQRLRGHRAGEPGHGTWCGWSSGKGCGWPSSVS